MMNGISRRAWRNKTAAALMVGRATTGGAGAHARARRKGTAALRKDAQDGAAGDERHAARVQAGA